MDMRQIVGRNIRKYRQQRDLTQDQFAELSGFPQNYVSDLERGRRNPTVVTLWHLAEALGVAPMELLRPEEGSSSDDPE